MNGTKWYKLNKSNEPLQIILEEHFNKLEESISEKITSVIFSIGEIALSTVLSYIVTNYIALSKKHSIPILILISCGIFIGIVIVAHCLGYGIRVILKFIKDKKSTPNGMHELEIIFYKKVLNDIVTGISLEKKATELYNQNDENSTPNQNDDLRTIYLVESIFYFNEATADINANNIFEINNSDRPNYTDFLSYMNYDVICNILNICVSTLTRIEGELQKLKLDVPSAKDARITFENYIKFIEKQMSSEENKN